MNALVHIVIKYAFPSFPKLKGILEVEGVESFSGSFYPI